MSYRALRSIGRGGMAEVFLARAPNGTEVVMKRLLPMHRDNEDFLRMFEVEGEVGLAVQHPNVVHTVAAGRDTEGPYLVLEYLKGMDLRSVRRKLSERGARLPLASALYIVSCTLDGLQAAHDARAPNGRPLHVVHRDVSPSNVILTDAGDVKLIDFGVARRDTEEESTRPGTLKGKIAYMAPEQLRHEIPDARADVYSAGIMLYELLLGRRPYVVERPGEFELMLAIVRHAVAEPASIDPHVPRQLAAMVMRAMALMPADRYPSAAAFAQDLRAFAQTKGLVLHAADVVQLLAEHGDHPAAPPDADSASVSFGHVLGPGAPWITPDVVGPVAVLTLEGSLDAGFPGAALGAALSGEVLLDLHGVDRITPAGTEAWLALVGQAKRARIAIARASEAVVDRIGDVAGFLGASVVLSFEARVRCQQCGTFGSILVATQGLGTGPPEEPCAVCGGRAVFEDRYGTLDLLRTFAHVPLSPDLARAARHVEKSSARDLRAIEKRIDHDATRIRVRASLPPGTRLDRLFQGIEGKLVLDLSGLRDASEAFGTRFAQALRNLERDVTEVHIEACPLSLYDALGGPRPTERIQIDDLATTVDCPQCGRNAALPWRPWRDEPLVCARCGKGPARSVPLVLAKPRAVWALAAGAVLLSALAAVAWYFTIGIHHGP